MMKVRVHTFLVVTAVYVVCSNFTVFAVPQKGKPCHDLVGSFPAIHPDALGTDNNFARFELHRCENGTIQVYGFEAGASLWTLFFDTGDDYPNYLAHIRSVLVLESHSGSGNHVYVFAFEKGKPKLVLETGTKGQIEVRRSEGFKELVEVLVPRFTEADINGKRRPLPSEKHVFSLEQ